VLQCVCSLCCNVLQSLVHAIRSTKATQHAELYSRALQCCSALQSVLQCVADSSALDLIKKGDKGCGGVSPHPLALQFVAFYVAVCLNSVLQCVAVRCSALQCVAVCCSVLQCAAVCCSVLYSTLQCLCTLCCSVLQSSQHYIRSRKVTKDAEVCPRTLEPGTPVADAAICSPDPHALPNPPDPAPSPSAATWLVSPHPSVCRDWSTTYMSKEIPVINKILALFSVQGGEDA